MTEPNSIFPPRLTRNQRKNRAAKARQKARRKELCEPVIKQLQQTTTKLVQVQQHLMEKDSRLQLTEELLVATQVAFNEESQLRQEREEELEVLHRWIKTALPAFENADIRFLSSRPHEDYGQEWKRDAIVPDFSSSPLMKDWNPITRPTLLYLGGKDDASDELDISVIFDAEGIKSARAEIISTLSLFKDFRPNLPHGTTLKQSGMTYGFGWRAGYAAQAGKYQPLRKAKDKDSVFEEKARRIPAIMDRVFKKYFNKEAEVNSAIVEQYSAPHLDDCDTAVSIYSTEDYLIQAHTDPDSGYTMIIWLLDCTTKCSCNSCTDGYAFIFPQYKMYIPLRDNVCVIFRASSVIHGTIGKKPQSCSIVRRAMAFQIKDTFLRKHAKHGSK